MLLIRSDLSMCSIMIVECDVRWLLCQEFGFLVPLLACVVNFLIMIEILFYTPLPKCIDRNLFRNISDSNRWI